MTIYMWNLGTEKEVGIQHITLADTSILTFMQVDCQVLRVGSIRQSWQGFLGGASESWIPESLSPLFNYKHNSSIFPLNWSLKVLSFSSYYSSSPTRSRISENGEEPNNLSG